MKGTKSLLSKNLQTAKMSGSFNLLLLSSDLDSLGINKLLELLLLGNQEVILMGISLSWDSVQSW